MKKPFTALICALIVALSLPLASCSAPFTFAFLSVRLKGNGDGTVTAVAQHEFSLGGTEFYITLTLIRKESASSEEFTEVERLEGSLPALKTLQITADINEAGYYTARLDYEVGGEIKTILSDTVFYGADGLRVKV